MRIERAGVFSGLLEAMSETRSWSGRFEVCSKKKKVGPETLQAMVDAPATRALAPRQEKATTAHG